MIEKNHYLWCEKYRPQVLNQYIGNQHLKDKVKRYLQSEDIPHLLLYGKPGTGKTTLAKILIKNIKCDYLYINASDENKVDDVRIKIKNFASSIGFNPLKILILDEADYLTPNAQAALRNLMETFSKNTRFILTCNYVERIVEPIQSRCQTYKVVPPSKKEVALHLKNILELEKIIFELDDIAVIINSCYPDIRQVINSTQRQVIDNKLVLDVSSIVHNNYKIKLLELLNNRDSFNEIRQLVADNFVNDYADLFKLLYDEVDNYAEGKVSETILEIAEAQYRDQFVVDKEINFMALIINILKVI
jgi:replication factor C small subunit|tara:strand:- start:325 stop:1236 length:912 start_codon:yes stop_codon:yes gene_type:complete